MTRKVLAPFMSVAVAAGLVFIADPAIAQPPGKGGFDKGKGFDKWKGSEKGSGDAVRTLEAELAKLKALEAEVESKLKSMKSEGRKQPMPPAPGGFGRPGGFGPPSGFGPPGGFGPGKGGPGSFGPPGMGGLSRGPGGMGGLTREHEMHGGSHHGMSGAVHGIVRAASGLSSEQLKEVIAALQKLQSEKHRATAPAPRAFERPGSRPEGRPTPPTSRSEARPTPAGRPGASTNEQILERLDRLARELDEIRRAVRK